MVSTVTKVGISLAVFGAALTPSLAFADTGILNVYVLVNNNDNQPHRSVSDFTFSVGGTNVSPSIFQGSPNGTNVLVGEGNYVVTVVSNQYGFTPSYTQGCSGVMHNGQTALCTVTMNPSYTYNTYPTVYPFPFTIAPLSCVSQVTKVGLRQNVSFTAQGGVGGTYNWQVPGRSYPNAGPVLTVSFDNTGTQLVTVTNATQTATCMIDVVQGGYVPPVAVAPIYPSFPATYYTSYPHLPNTGVEPLTAAQIALALVLLTGAAFISAPYVRKAYSIVTK